MMTTQTFTAEQIEAIGGRRWTKSDGTVRVYLNGWADMVGLEVNYYRTGNVSSAAVHGETISNNRAARLSQAKVFWENGNIVTTNLTLAADDCRLNGEAMAAELLTSIAARVEEATS